MFGGELALPVSGGPRQPLDMQVRYYSEATRLASEVCGDPLSPGPEWDSTVAGTAPIRPQTRKTPLQSERRFAVLRWSLASQAIVAGGCFHRAYSRLPRLVSLLRAASLEVALAGRLVFFGLAGIHPAAGTSLAPSL